MKYLELTQGQRAVVDDEDWVRVSRWKWHASRKGKTGEYYACRNRRTGEGGPKSRLLHYAALGLEQPLRDGRVIDHINGRPLDCRKANLRVCTHQENLRNQRAQRRGTSRYRGVYWQRQRGKWTAKIKCDGRSEYLGLFRTEYAAAAAYNVAAAERFGLFARLNRWEGPTACPPGPSRPWEAIEPGVTGAERWAERRGMRRERFGTSGERGRQLEFWR